LIQAKDDSSVLDVGCGDGILLGYIIKQAKATKSNWKTIQYHGIDISSEMIKCSKKNYPKDATFIHTGFLNFQNEKLYSAIVFNECFHYFEDSSVALKKALACLEVDGKIIISHPKGFRNVDFQRSKNAILVPSCLPNIQTLTEICDSCNARIDLFPDIDADSYLCVLQKNL
jgi:ubiquinone/menaquinone biosynthesis C-methylase UbiE